MGVSPGGTAVPRGRRWRRGVAGRLSWLDVEASALATSVAVMAPALTEGGPQKPENLLPTLPAGGFLSAEQAKQVCDNREVLAQFVVSANVQPSKIDEQCLQGIPKDLINDVINFKFGNGFEGLSDLIVASPKDSAGAATARETHASSAAIMSDPSMGDPTDSMCFSKFVMGPGETEESAKIAELARKIAERTREDGDTIADDDKQFDEERSLEQIMGFASDINVPTTDISQNVDDILQAINSIETEEGSAESIGGNTRLTDECGGLVESSSQGISESVSEIFPDGEAFPLTLLNDVDVMGLCNDNLSDNGSAVDREHQQLQLQHHQQQQLTKLEEVTESQSQVERRQNELERKMSFLMRRLRKVQSRLVGEHVAEEASYVLELAQKSARKCIYQDLASLTPKAGNTRNFPELAGSVSSFLQKVRKSCVAQNNSFNVRHRNVCRYFGAGSRDNYINTSNRMPTFGVPQIKIDGKEVEKVAGPLATKLKILQDAYDSDCTASSSGGESCDEMQTFNNPHQQQLPISKRAGWRYAQDRASVASRWTWLQAQIADLEYKIRQHNDLQRQIRAAKGLVMLEAPLPTMTTTTTTTTPPTTTTTTPALEAPINGYSGTLSGSRCGSGFEGPTETGVSGYSNYGASRTRPFVKSLYRKRKLVHLQGLHEVSRKAARPATLRCSCDGSLAPCALCTGRRDPTPSQDTLDLLSVPERVAALDPGFHPVLSMPDEIIHSVHMDSIMKTYDWQQKINRGNLRVTKLKDKDTIERRNKKTSDHRPNYPPRLKKSQTSLVSARIKRKVLKDKRNRSNSDRPNHGVSRKRASKHPHQQQLQHQSQLPATAEEEEASALSSSSKYSSPVPSPLQQQLSANPTATATAALAPPSEKNTLKEKSSNTHGHSRLRQNSYDIDNIVIPYSVASSTRLEKLPYKEIQIPKWRVCDDPLSSDVKNGAVQKPMLDNDVEDVSDETIVLRHERSEKEENKRFMTYINLPYQTRIRPNRRTDSRADSGANTPDPLSPHASDFGGDTMSPITTPPATPSNLHDMEHLQGEAHHRSGSLQNALRRRTMSTSTSRSQKEEPATPVNEEEHELVLPYEPRTFPLTDEDYSKMLESMPIDHLSSQVEAEVEQRSQVQESINVAELDSAEESDSTESAYFDNEGEDPNDPEWTVAECRETEKDRIRPTAKR